MPLIRTDMITDEPLPQAADYLCFPWLYPGRFSLFVGVTNVGKTTITLEMIAGMLKGGHLWDRFPCKKIERVCYFHGEHTLATLQEAAKSRGDIPKGAVTVVHDFGDNGSSLIVNETVNVPLVKEIHAVIADVKPQLIVFEPLSAFLGTSENANLEVRTVINILASLGARHHAAVMGHHHTGKAAFDPERPKHEGIASGEARGAMAFEDASERVIYLHRVGDKNSTHITLETPKAKGFPINNVRLSFDPDTLTYTYVSQPLAERDLLAVYNRRRFHPDETIRDMMTYFQAIWSAGKSDGASNTKLMLLLKRAAKVGLLSEEGWAVKA